MTPDLLTLDKYSVIVLMILNFVAIVTSVFSIWRSFKLTPKEVAREDASAAEVYAKTAVMSEQRAEKLSLRLDELERQFERISMEYDYSLKVLADWARGIELLLYQIKNAGITAVWIPKHEDLHKFKQNGISKSEGQIDKADEEHSKKKPRQIGRKPGEGV